MCPRDCRERKIASLIYFRFSIIIIIFLLPFKKNDELGDEIRSKLAEIKQRMVEEALVIFEAEEKKKKKKKDYIP